MFTKVSTVFACIIASSNFLLVNVSWNSLQEAENMHEQQENLPYFSFFWVLWQTFVKYFVKLDGIVLNKEGIFRLYEYKWRGEMSTKQRKSLNILGSHPKVCVPVTNYIMTWSLLASSNSTCVFNPCNMIQRQWLLKPEGMLKHLLLHSRLKESLQYFGY